MDDFDQRKKLKEQRRKIREERELQLKDDLRDLIEYSKTTDCSESIKTKLTPLKDWRNFIKGKPEWKDLILAYKKSKDMNFQLLGVLIISAFIWNKPAFLLSQSIMCDLLKGNTLIKRQTISWKEYGAFIAFLIKNSFLNVEIESTGKKQARLFSIKGTLLNVYDAYAFEDPKKLIESIKTDYLETEKKKIKKPEDEATPPVPKTANSENNTAPSESDLAIVEKVMSLSHRFNEFEKQNFPEIANKVKKYGSFKGDQKKLFENFLKNKWNY